MTTAIKVENLSKIYQLGNIGTGTISKDLQRWWTTRILGKEDPFLKIGQINDRTTKSNNDIVYSLRDINFEIAQGDAVGIIGRNGAGKSTLLKILSRVTAPTTGKINIKGRVASLLEVGTGFHPELTGRENIYLNGAILGMRKAEITRKLDEIIDFSGVERYIDTPVKRYSSGMYVRLAFAVAAHLESEILIVDEVLAVGDAEFQKKCLGKMGEVSQGDGRTVLFVSHNMAAIKFLCSHSILLSNGMIHSFNETNNVIKEYINNTLSVNQSLTFDKSIREGNQSITVRSFELLNSINENVKSIVSGETIKFRFHLVNNNTVDGDKKVRIGLGINNANQDRIAHIDSYHKDKTILIKSSTKDFIIEFTIEKFPFNEGQYSFAIMIMVNEEISDWIKIAKEFYVVKGDFYNTGKLPETSQSPFLLQYEIIDSNDF